jgi:mono/diheme cytochrome c family protein
MDIRTRLGLLVLLGTVVPAAAAHAQGKLPDGVTQEMVDKGKAIFAGAGNCYACHGQNAQGMLGPTTNLTDATWIHSDGTYPKIVEYVKVGVTKEQSKSGIPMPPRGGSKISDEEVSMVAAYVYSLSHK